MSSFTEHYDAVPESASRARERVAEFAAAAGASRARLDDIRLAVSEAVTNAVLHGYAGADGEVRVSARADAGGLSIVVRDTGAGLSRRSPRTTSGLGLGLSLIAKVAEDLAVEPGSGAGTAVRMRFALADQPLVAAAA